MPEVSQLVHPSAGHCPSIRPVILAFRDPSKNTQSAAQSALEAKGDVCVKSISNHTSPFPVEMEFPLDSVHHRLTWFA